MKQILKGLVLFFVLFTCSLSYAQSVSDCFGTYNGKLSMKSMGWEEKNCKINEVVIHILIPNKILITYHYKLVFPKEFKQDREIIFDFKGRLEGTVKNDLTFEAKGNRICVGVNDLKNHCIGRIENKLITGDVILDADGPGIIREKFSVPTEIVGEKCDIDIAVPPDLKPGSDFYVVINKTGCVSYYTIYYNGKDKPIPNWDGKAVDVEVQVECCDHSAFMKKLRVPDYGSGEKLITTTTPLTKPEDNGPLPLPTPKQLLTAPLASLLVLTLLQTLLGGGSKTTPPIPPEDTTPKEPKPKEPTPKDTTPKDPKPKEPLPKDPPPKEPLPKDPQPKEPLPKDSLPKDPPPKDPMPKEILPKNSLPKDSLPKDTNQKGPTPKDKAEKMKQMEARQDELRKQAIQENISVASYFTLVKNMFQTIPASSKEVYDTEISAVKNTAIALKTAGQFAKELYDNPKERQRLSNNMGDIISHAIYESCDIKTYIPAQAKALKEHVLTSLKFNADLFRHPITTIIDYATDTFALHNYANAMDPNRSLEWRLANLGWAYGKTYSAISTGTSGSILRNCAFHQKNILVEKLVPYLPGMWEDAKKNIIIEGIKVKANNYYYTNVDVKPENTTNVHIANNILEDMKKSFENKTKNDEVYDLWKKAMNHTF